MQFPIQLDKQRNLKYTFEEIELVEETLNVNWDDLLVKFLKGKARVKEIFTMVWAGLYREDKELTVGRVKELVYEHSTLDTVMFEMGRAIGEAMKHIKSESVEEKN